MIAALLSIIVAILKRFDSEKFHNLGWILNHFAIGFVTGTLFCDIIKMNLGLDPALSVNDTLKS